MSFLILMLLLLRLSFHKAKEPSVTPVDKSGKVFDCHHYNLLVARLNAYGFDRDALKLDISYLKGKNNVHASMITVATSLNYYQVYYKVPYWGPYYLITF